MQDHELDQLLARAAAAPPTPSPGLIERVLADALAEQDRIARPARPTASTARSSGTGGMLERIAAAFGGGPILAGVFSAALSGVAVGYLEPDTLNLLTGNNAELLDLFPEVDFLTTEG